MLRPQWTWTPSAARLTARRLHFEIRLRQAEVARQHLGELVVHGLDAVDQGPVTETGRFEHLAQMQLHAQAGDVRRRAAAAGNRS